MGHDHSLNYYAVYCPITIITNAISKSRRQKNEGGQGIHAIGSSHNMSIQDNKLPVQKHASAVKVA